MRYEKIRCDRDPYKLWIGAMSPFGEHRHGDYELAYCLEGSLDIILDKQTVSVKEGDLLIIPPMTAHCVNEEKGHRRFLCVILGVSFFKGYYSSISDFAFPSNVISLDPALPDRLRIRRVLEDTVKLCSSADRTAELMKAGNLYHLMAMLIQHFSRSTSDLGTARKDMTKVANVERALELIYSSYMEPLTVEQASEASGYSKSNFCKIFKQVTGSSFHKLLNAHRVSNACNLLSDTELRISEIAREVGFGETKTLCRVFREEMGMSPLEYRNSCGK